MARSTPPRRSAELSVEQMRRGVSVLERRISEIESFDVSLVQDQFHHPELDALELEIGETLARCFGNGTADYLRYQAAGFFNHDSIHVGDYPCQRFTKRYSSPLLRVPPS
jgi:hypothetical protein